MIKIIVMKVIIIEKEEIVFKKFIIRKLISTQMSGLQLQIYCISATISPIFDQI